MAELQAESKKRRGRPPKHIQQASVSAPEPSLRVPSISDAFEMLAEALIYQCNVSDDIPSVLAVEQARDDATHALRAVDLGQSEEGRRLEGLAWSQLIIVLEGVLSVSLRQS